MTRARIALGALAYAALLAHLLFIPYLYSPLPWDETMRRFAQLPWMQLGSDQNVALVSRGLMFAPLGLLLAAWVAPEPRRIEVPALMVAAVLGCLWATVVNIAQLWFQLRTVSLNNLAAESVGVIAGALLWSALGATGQGWWRRLASGGGVSAAAALTGYAILYVAASLTPFDFVTSAGELAEKAASNLYGLWFAPISCGPAPCGLKFASTTLVAIPCGWWFASRRRGGGNAWLSVVPVALVFATIIELLHFLMVSGVSQGASVIARASGIVLGAATYSSRQRLASVDFGQFGRLAVLALLVPYLAAIAYVGGWFRAPKVGVTAGIARLPDVVWMPFYYQYYTAYQSTMYSTLVHAALYAPVGVACWLWARHRDSVPLWRATLLAALLATVAETSKVLLAGHLPDYSDVVIAAVSATVVLAVLRFVSRSHYPPQEFPAGPHSDSAPERGAASGNDLSAVDLTAATAGSRVAGVLLIAIAALTVIGFPVAPWALAVALVGYAVILRHFPTATYLIAIPLLLPVFDLAPFSGRFFWDEFDVLLAVTLGVRLLTVAPTPLTRIPVPKTAFWLLFASVIASAAISVWPIAPVDQNAFTSYLSTYNALRIAKGYVWSAGVVWLMWRDASGGRNVVPPLRLGLALGLLTATLGVFWERLLFVGSSDLGAVFRASGLVSATHVGGAYLEAILVLLAPFGLAMAVAAKRWPSRLMWYVVVLLGAVAILMTLSRAAVFAWVISVAVFAGVWWLKLKRDPAVSHRARRQWEVAGAFLALIAVAVLASSFSQLGERLGQSKSDLSIRVAHWKETIDLMRPGALHLFLGSGLGSFPREYYLAYAATNQLPGYRLEQEMGSVANYLVLTGGLGMYIDQRVVAGPGVELRLRGQIRSPQTGTHLSVGMCQKSYLNSVSCDGAIVAAGPTWRPFEVRLLSPKRAEGRLAPEAPTSLSLHNPVFGTRAEVAQLSLVDADTELLRNGSFEHGLDRWFMTSDAHLAWRTKNTLLQVAFEQGALGVLAWLAVSVAAFAVVLGPTSLPGATAAFAAAMIGFLAVGCFDSLLDSPRMILLVALIGAMGLFSSGKSTAAQLHPTRLAD